MPPKKVAKKVSLPAGLIARTGEGGRGGREHRQESIMSSTEFDSTRTPRAGTPTSATRIIAAALALAALGVAVVVCVSQGRTHHTTSVVLVDSSSPDTITSTGTGTAASAPTSQASIYPSLPSQTWSRVIDTVQVVPQTISETVTPRPAPCPTKLRLCEPVHF
jgi:hypothetical protein